MPIKLDMVKEILIALSTKLGFIADSEVAAEEFPIGLTEVAKKAKSAAGIIYFDIR